MPKQDPRTGIIPIGKQQVQQVRAKRRPVKKPPPLLFPLDTEDTHQPSESWNQCSKNKPIIIRNTPKENQEVQAEMTRYNIESEAIVEPPKIIEEEEKMPQTIPIDSEILSNEPVELPILVKPTKRHNKKKNRTKTVTKPIEIPKEESYPFKKGG